VSLTGGQRNDVTQLMPLIAAIRGSAAGGAARASGRMRSTPTGAMTMTSTVAGREKGITPLIARRASNMGLAWACTAGGGAVDRAAALVPAAAHPLGDPRRHPRGLPQSGLQHYLLAPPANLALC